MNKEESLLPSRCKKCLYSYRIPSGYYICEHILVTGEPRGCAADENCTKFPKRKRRLKTYE